MNKFNFIDRRIFIFLFLSIFPFSSSSEYTNDVDLNYSYVLIFKGLFPIPRNFFIVANALDSSGSIKMIDGLDEQMAYKRGELLGLFTKHDSVMIGKINNPKELLISSLDNYVEDVWYNLDIKLFKSKRDDKVEKFMALITDSDNDYYLSILSENEALLYELIDKYGEINKISK